MDGALSLARYLGLPGSASPVSGVAHPEHVVRWNSSAASQ